MFRFLAAFTGLLLLSAWPAWAQTTQWRVHSAEGLDALLLIGAASGDRLQAEHYADDIAWVRRTFSPAGLAALDRLDHTIRVSGGNLVGPQLALVFSAAPIDSLADVAASARDSEGRLRPAFAASLYWNAEQWPDLVARMPDVATALGELERNGFHERWLREWRPAIAAAVETDARELRGYDLIPQQQRLLGRALDPTIDVLVVHFSEPYGIKIMGQRFITHHTYPQALIFQNAAHEMFHPPFDPNDWSLMTRLTRLEHDAWVHNIVTGHDPSFGYNSFEGLFDEDSTQALDQIVSERMGAARHPDQRWRDADGGMHMMAAALYDAMKADGFDRRGGVYSEWLKSALDRGLLTPAEVRRRAARVVGAAAVAKWNVSRAPSATQSATQ